MKKRKKLKRLKLYFTKKIRVNVLDALSYNRLWGLEFTRITFFFLIIFFCIILFFSSYLVLIYSPVKEVFSINSKYKETLSVEKQYLKIQQLEKKIEVQTRYIDDFKNVILGKPIPSDNAVNNIKDSLDEKLDIQISQKPSPHEQEFSHKIEKSIRENTAIEHANQSAKGIFFFTPVVGIISSKFSKNHPAIDIVAKENSPVKSVFDGTVIFSDWTQANGYTIIIQHPNNFLSIYKHNSLLLKKQGDFVRAGDPVAIIGNTGENTTGAHLHFELLFDGKNVNPLDYISFQ